MAGEQLVGLAERLQAICLGRGLTVAIAESCTGGLVADAITDIPGSSGYFLGGIVSYADTAKAALLGVPAEVLAAHGAVSAQVGRAMAEGARERFSADLAAAVEIIAAAEEVEKALAHATERLKRDLTDEALGEQQRLIGARRTLRDRLAQLAGTD